MKKQILANVLVLIGTILFNFLFWRENLGVNVLIFTIFLLGGLSILHPKSFHSRSVSLISLGTILAAIMVVWHNTTISKTTFILSTITLIGLVQQRELRFLAYGFLLALSSFFEVPKQLLARIKWESDLKPTINKIFRTLARAFLPLLIIVLFFQLYYFANPKFAELYQHFKRTFLLIFDWHLSFNRIAFWLGSFMLVAGIFWETKTVLFLEKQQQAKATLERIRIPNRLPGFKNLLALKNEYRNAIFLIFALNVLLCIVNWTDIQFVWFNFEGGSPQELSQYVHSGTYLLIISILFAIAVLLFFFRKNLNFYPNNRLLKILSYIWIIQNAILTCSVAIRNFHYVYHYGLAYKRIGVFIFLILVWVGLMWLMFKIKEKRTFYYLLHRNVWTLYLVLLLSSSLNWDVFITQYNLFAPTKHGIDAYFLIYEVSDKNLFLLEQHQHILEKRSVRKGAKLEAALRHKRQGFEKRQKEQTCLSWNYADAKNLKKR